MNVEQAEKIVRIFLSQQGHGDLVEMIISKERDLIGWAKEIEEEETA